MVKLDKTRSSCHKAMRLRTIAKKAPAEKGRLRGVRDVGVPAKAWTTSAALAKEIRKRRPRTKSR